MIVTNILPLHVSNKVTKQKLERLLLILNKQLKNKPHDLLTQHLKYCIWTYSVLLTSKHIFSELIFLASVTNFLASSFESEKNAAL